MMIQENPNYFTEKNTLVDTQAWGHWDQAILWLAAIGVFILLLIAIKLLRKKLKQGTK